MIWRRIKEFFQDQAPRRARAPKHSEPCWCGTGVKYKRCCFDQDKAADQELEILARNEPKDVRSPAEMAMRGFSMGVPEG